MKTWQAYFFRSPLPLSLLVQDFIRLSIISFVLSHSFVRSLFHAFVHLRFFSFVCSLFRMLISLFIRWRVSRLFIRLFVCRVLLSVRLFIFPVLEKFWLKSAVRRKMVWVSRNPFPQIMSLKHMHRSKLSEESSLARNQLRTNQFLDCVSYCNKQKSLILANSHFFSVQLQFTWLIQGMGIIPLQSSIEIEKVTWFLL